MNEMCVIVDLRPMRIFYGKEKGPTYVRPFYYGSSGVAQVASMPASDRVISLQEVDDNVFDCPPDS